MVKTRTGHKDDLLGILALQKRYLHGNLNALQRKKGFVTTPFTHAQLEDLLQQNGIFIAENDNNIVAYAFAGPWSYFEQWEIFNVMVSRFPRMFFHGTPITTQNSFQYGPVCIDETYRGKGLLNQLFEEMRNEFLKTYPISVTFINKVNVISEKAHVKKLGWEKIDEFEFNNNQYIALAFDMKKSVLK